MSVDTEDTNLKMVGLELMFLTPEKYSHEDGITAVELAKLVNLPVDEVKKKLQILKEKNINVREIISKKPIYIRWIIYYILILYVLIFGAYLGPYIPVDPMYANF